MRVDPPSSDRCPHKRRGHTDTRGRRGWSDAATSPGAPGGRGEHGPSAGEGARHPLAQRLQEAGREVSPSERRLGLKCGLSKGPGTSATLRPVFELRRHAAGGHRAQAAKALASVCTCLNRAPPSASPAVLCRVRVARSHRSALAQTLSPSGIRVLPRLGAWQLYPVVCLSFRILCRLPRPLSARAGTGLDTDPRLRLSRVALPQVLDEETEAQRQKGPRRAGEPSACTSPELLASLDLQCKPPSFHVYPPQRPTQ